MSKSLTSLIISGFTATAMLATSAFAQPAPSGTVLETTPSELRAAAGDKMDAVVDEAVKSSAAEAEKAAAPKAEETQKTKKHDDVKKKDKKKKGKKSKKKAEKQAAH